MKTIEHIITIVNVLFAVNVFIGSGCPNEIRDAKAAYKSGEIHDQSLPITLDNIKRKLKESGVFDWQDRTLNEREKKELSKLFDAVEIMTTSRNRQPSNVQNVFSSLRLVERVVKKQLKEGQISETLAAKFRWDKLSTKHRREKPTYYIDKKTSMRIFDTKN
ncbi:jg20028 [Pararge aegeria aegeria]|uniref:Jg20028 protein n=1 Tax=Pararge aegeria aegeria TaxID=348720 RepID=A0A8S4R7G1_9NEOP|nr:jg20028 [Pararge aegeria aegeria]